MTTAWPKAASRARRSALSHVLPGSTGSTERQLGHRQTGDPARMSLPPSSVRPS